MAQYVEKQRRTLKIKIKLGGVAIGPKGVSGITAAHIKSNVLSEEVLLKARRRRKLLDGYPEPSDSAYSIVASLRSGWQELQTVPCWDESLAVPANLESFAVRWNDQKSWRQPKRSRSGSACRDLVEAEAGSCQQSEVHQSSSHESAQIQDASIGRASDSPKANASAVNVAADSKAACQDMSTSAQKPDSSTIAVGSDHQHLQGPGSSTSDQAIQIPYHLSSSPEQEDDAHAVSAVASLPWQQEHTACSHNSLQHDTPFPVPSLACQAGPGLVLPPSCLEPVQFSGAAISMSSISPFDMHMPCSSHGASESLDEAAIHSTVQTILETARSRKYAAEKERGGRPWTVRALCKYVESAITFMEACEYMLKGPKTQERGARLAILYNSTSALLVYTIKFCETAVGSDLSKSALRILAERLSAVCLMREAAHSQSRLLEASSKAQQLSLKYSQAPPGLPPSAGRSANDGVHGQPSPDGSANSSHDIVTESSGAVQLEPAHVCQPAHAESLQRLLEQGRRVARFSDQMRRSTNGFQALIERPDYCSNQDAKLASMHIAAISMDMGMLDGFRMLAHANKATSYILAVSR